MAVVEGKKITIPLPKLAWKSLLNFRFGLILAMLLAALAFYYWYVALRPFLWISKAHIESYTAPVSCDMSGKIAEMGPEVGETVQKGRLLFALDRELILAQAKLTQDSVNGCKEEIRSEKMRMEKAMNEYLALSSDSTFGSDQGEEIAKHLKTMEEAQGKSEAITGELAMAQNKLSLLDLQLRKMVFNAPFEGVVLKKGKAPGAVIAYGEEVYVLSDPSITWIDAQVPESELGRIKVGAEARILLSAYPNKEWKGKVLWIGPATSSKTSPLSFSKETETIPIKISIEPLDRSLKPGLSAQVGLKIY